jgi:hypothetical protein
MKSGTHGVHHTNRTATKADCDIGRGCGTSRKRASLLVVCAAAGVLTTQALGQTTTLWNCGDGNNDHVYRVVATPNGISWTSANTAATNAGGYLASLTTAEESAFVFSLVNSEALWMRFGANGFRGGPWIGGRQINGNCPDCGWTWTSGEPWDYRNWETGQPNNAGGSDQTYLQFGNNTVVGNTWNDQINDTNPRVRGYVIEWPSVFERQPADLFVCPRGSASMSAPIRGGLDANSFTKRWQIESRQTPGVWRTVNDGDLTANVGGVTRVVGTISGATTSQLNFVASAEFSSAWGGAAFRCVIVNACGSITSDPAALGVCNGDVNCDSFIDFFDYDTYVSCFEGDFCPPGTNADFNADGFVDFFDYADFVTAFEAGC